MAERVYYLQDKNKIEGNEKLQRKSYYLEAASNFGKDKEGYFLYIKSGDEDFFDEVEVLKEIEELKGKEKKEILKKFRKKEEEVASGFGLF